MTTVPTGREKTDATWTTQDASDLYGIDSWGQGYFSVTDAGTIAVRPARDEEHQIDLYELVEGLRARGIHTPVLLRFTDLLKSRLTELRDAFDTAIRENEYGGSYTCVYPIKVNQQRPLCEEIRDFGDVLGFGLEAGSKPELLAVLGLTENRPNMPIVCNGFKDQEYVETVVLATKLGRRIVPVVEQAIELDLIIEQANRYGVRPMIGVRIKPSARGAGRWESSGGMRSKFGLQVSEVLAALEKLRNNDMLDCLRLVHFHVGSQICDIRQLKNAISELAHTYTELRRLGATQLDMIDIGGGLGVDYDGSQSSWASSVNYSVREYASDVVYRIKAACDDVNQPHPMIVSESGRAMAAYSSVLVVDVLGKSHFPSDPDLPWIRRTIDAERASGQEIPQPVIDLLDAYEGMATREALENYHDSIQARDEAMTLFGMGYMSLPMRAVTERLFWAIGRKVIQITDEDPESALADQIGDLGELLSDIYFCNFSLFQSLPDSWAIDQLFPIVPIQRLNDRPRRRAILADITCDSDGQISRFSSTEGQKAKKTLELHELRGEQPYYLAFFLVGAYQEVLGDLHNLFGDTHAVHVSQEEDGSWSIGEVVEGDTVREVLSYLQFDPSDLRRAMRRDTERAVREGRMSVEESRALLTFYESGLEGYTYLE
ncbi:MAG: biosynthetic arginine decarboxylase [Phycisphaeraceae bacterium]|nr:biosynthetic arginine decarboxylase [Phycisphaeraceae bacterium]MCW5761736.1 biosynthetic arginine decarboxylase [Phycisphaeraceae bacterium]